MSDTFHKSVPFEFIDKIFAVMALCRQHTFQVLTKRPERMAEYLARTAKSISFFDEAARSFGHTLRFEFEGSNVGLCPWPLKNVWLGTSCEDQEAADERIPYLLKCPASVRFLSCEPLLGPINLNKNLGGTLWIGGQRGCGATHKGIGTPECPREPHHHHDERCMPGIDWAIVGGESGPGARAMDPEWARTLRDQCRPAGVSFFMKQMDKKEPIPEDLYVRQFPKMAV
jgi:protein gp37